MAERKKIREYRQTLHEMAKPQTSARRKHLEGKAAKLGTEIHGEESKGKPKTKPRR
jgi:hypothetical protein